MLLGTGARAVKNTDTQPDLMGVSHQLIRTITKVSSGCYGRKILFSRIILPAQRSTKPSSRQAVRMDYSLRVEGWRRGEFRHNWKSKCKYWLICNALKASCSPTLSPGVQERSPWVEELCTDSLWKRKWYSGWEMVQGSSGKINQRQWLWGNVRGKLHPDNLAQSLSFSPIPSCSYTSFSISFECLSSPIPLFPCIFFFLPYSFLLPSRQPSASLTYLLPPWPSTLPLYPGWSSWKQGQIHQPTLRRAPELDLMFWCHCPEILNNFWTTGPCVFILHWVLKIT